MNKRDDAQKEERRIDLNAARWLVKRDRGLTPREQDDYLQWIAADPRHAQWVARHEETWADFDHLVQWRPEHSPARNPDVLAPPARPTVRWKLPAVAALAASLAVGLALWRPWQTTAPQEEMGGHSTLVADAYERRALPDGSVVELNRDTVLELSFNAAERRVTLARGEAHFTVASNPRRPFVVTARGIGVRAVGTAFNVRLASSEVDVLVTEGRVKLEHPERAAPRESASPTLGANERAIIPLEVAAAPRISVVSAEEMARLLEWQPEMFQFDSTPLAHVIAEFNRRNRVQLIVKDPGLATMPIVASFRSDNPEGFVRLLTVTAGVEAERRGDSVILRGRKRE